ncbi:acyl-CoA dehydrogenase family protein [Fulvivirgaceae bacterium BMA10]|uniref:Acyl-CoA dehydrogenase family protein n=1 Tax=Splendidivirga corallicola TaxID=3051826 RepID=A0ABT8L1C7_9BACT|nr:acyl-CoA dehydrogenase family protein [Fulvivirgaceae bacterium BMA10]
MQPWEDSQIDEIREKYSQFAKEHLAGDRAHRDKEGDFSKERWKKAAESGFLNLMMPEELGGTDAPVTQVVAAIEGLGESCEDSGFLYAMSNQLVGIQLTLKQFASEEVKTKFLPALMNGDRMAAYAFTEDTSGSDAYSMETTAVEDGDGFRINGTKSYLTNAPYSDLALVFAKTADNRGPFSLTAFWVDLNSEGASHGREFEKMGLRTVRMGEMVFDNVYVPKSHIVGVKGGGLRVLTESTGWERSVLIATALGPMRRGLDQCLDRVKTRQQFDKPIGAFQQISAKIANMVMQQRLCRQVVYDLASKLSNGKSMQSCAQDAAIAKLFVSENFVQFELDALQIFGVRGYLLESFVNQDLRDSLSFNIWSGTSESLRNTIAKLEGVPVS